jgi:pimeloyl-ACP methyl ester carboxylesterase
MPYVIDNKTRLHYHLFGKGKKVMLAFHGYAQEGSYYDAIAKVLKQDYTIFAFDLFFHGKSELHRTDMPLTKERLAHIMNHFLEKNQIGRFDLMAFSMGGKFALAMIETFAPRVERVFLIAPDGIRTNFWYNVATYPGWLQGMFKRTVLRPAPFFRLVRTLDRYKIVDKGLLRFANFHMGTTNKRLKVYRSWVGFRELSFDIRKIVRVLNEQEITVTFFLGEFDQVIPHHRLKVFIRSIKRANQIILNTGHTFMLYEVASYMQRHWYSGQNQP